jgi:hypothetical protein
MPAALQSFHHSVVSIVLIVPLLVSTLCPNWLYSSLWLVPDRPQLSFSWIVSWARPPKSHPNLYLDLTVLLPMAILTLTLMVSSTLGPWHRCTCALAVALARLRYLVPLLIASSF